MTLQTDRVYGGRPVADRRVERRNRFLDAALDVFATKGYATSSVTDVCAAAGLSRRQFYEEFTSRDDLLIAVYDRIQDGARAAVTEALTGLDSDDPWDVATAAITAYATAVADPRRAKVAFVEIVGVNDTVEQHRRMQRQLWAQVFEAGVRGLINADGTPPGGFTMASNALMGAANQLVHEWVLSDPQPPIADVIEVLTTILHALGTKRPSPAQ